MGRLSRKHKSGTGRNRFQRIGVGGLNTYHGNGQQGIKVPVTDGISVPDVDGITHPSSTDDAIQIPTAPVVTSPRRIVSPLETNYLSPFISSHTKKNATDISATLEMQPEEYCVFLTSMAKHGSSSKSQLPNLVVKIALDVVLVTIELSNTMFNQLSVRST